MSSRARERRTKWLSWIGVLRNVRPAVFGVLAFACAGRCRAEDVYAVRFFSISATDGFRAILWLDDIAFHNSTAAGVSVRLVGMSNGGLPDRPQELVVPAGRTVSARADGAERTNWFPRSGEPISLWVVHLDVPSGVLVQSRAEAHSTTTFGGVPPSPTPDLGVFSLPVFRTLTPANTTKVHLGADLGWDGNPEEEANYTNVGVYNAGSAPATAVIRLRQACNDAVLEERTLVIAPNTIVQVGGLRGSSPACSFPNPASIWMKYVTVRVDQPSLSYIVNKRTNLPFPSGISYGSAFSQ